MNIIEILTTWIADNRTTAIFFGLILAVGVVALVRFFFPLVRRSSAFKRAEGAIRDREEIGFPTAPFPTSQNWLNEVWRQYVSDYQDASVQIEGRPVSPVAPETVFTRSRVLRAYNRKAAVALAGVFLALGILGTFWGLVLGLQSVDTSTSDQLLTSVTSLLSGMSTAFWSSIGGITASIAWLLADRWVFNRFRSRVDRFFSTVKGKWPATPPDRAAFHVLALQVEQKNILQNLGTDLGQAFQDAIDKSFSQELSPALTSIDETLDRVASKVSDEQAEALDEMAAAFQERLLGSVQEQFDELATVIQDATDWQRRVTDDVGSLFEQVSELSETNTRLLKNSSEAADRFLSSLDRLSESQERMAQTAESLEEIAGETATLSRELQTQSEVFVDANTEIRNELAEQLDLVEQQVSSLSEFWQEVHGDLEQLSRSLSENLTEFTELTEEKLGEVFHRFDSEMSTVVEHLSGTLAELREVTEELAPTVQRVQAALEETLEPISGSRQEVAELTQSIRSLEGLPEHLGSASREMETARDALRDLSERIESLNGQLGDETGARERPEPPQESSEAEEPDDSGSSWGFGRG